jgi:ATP-binding cassette subfamily B protein
MGILSGLAADKYDRQYGDDYLIRRFATYVQPHRRRLFLIICVVFVFALIGAIIPTLISSVVNALETNAPAEEVLLLVGALFAVGLIDYGLYWSRRRMTSHLVADIISQLRKDAFDAAINRDLAFYDENKSGKVVSRITNDTQELSQIIIITTDIIAQVTEFVLLFFVLIRLEWRMTLILLCTMPVVMLVSTVFRHFARIVTRQGSRAMAVVNDNIQESVTGISVAKNFRQEAMIYNEFTQVNQQSYSINLKRGSVLALVFPTLNGLAGVAVATMVYVGGRFAIDGTVDVGVWFLFIQGVDRFWFPFINLASYWSQLQQGLSAVERIFALIDTENTIKQIDNKPAPADMKGKIEFQNVTFAYKTGDKILDDFNMTIQPGESIAFVGHTGAGKSSIVKLIERFYEFQGGKILVDGQDIRTFDIQSYRSKLGIVPQSPFLFSGTVMENIRYARPEASDAEIEEIASSVGRGEWLETLPNGLQSDVGERGARLSMGQRQLVSLLRVLVQKPAIFILDEATASIDPFTETQIQEALDMILARSTSILIAHRLSTVRSADRIVVLKEGRIIEQGNHDTLVAAGGHYAELYNTYFRHQSLSYVENARRYFDSEEMEKAGSV